MPLAHEQPFCASAHRVTPDLSLKQRSYLEGIYALLLVCRLEETMSSQLRLSIVALNQLARLSNILFYVNNPQNTKIIPLQAFCASHL